MTQQLDQQRNPSVLKAIASWRMIVILVLGFSSGIPLALTGQTLLKWMTDAGVDLTTIGLFAMVGTPYSLKFLWAPILDRYSIPFFGRRRGWILIMQALLVAVLMTIGIFDPSSNKAAIAAMAVAIAFFSATQDIVVDAYRREIASDLELGFATAVYINGYRIAMLVSGGVALGLADFMPWAQVYQIMAVVMLACMAVTFFAPEPKVTRTPQKLSEAVVSPFVEFFTRTTFGDGLIILLFILFYKAGDQMASVMTMTYYGKAGGFSNLEIAGVVKGFGIWASLAGAFLGGLAILKIGINKALWIFGFFQAASTACFVALLYFPHNLIALGAIVSFENITGGMGTAAYSAYMASMTNRKFTATQFALLTSIMSLPRNYFGAPTGYIAENYGWEFLFYFCTFAAIPGMLLLLKVAPWNAKIPPNEAKT